MKFLSFAENAAIRSCPNPEYYPRPRSIESYAAEIRTAEREGEGGDDDDDSDDGTSARNFSRRSFAIARSDR